MNIGAVSGFGSIYNSASSIQNNYKVNSIYGNPKGLDPVSKIGDGQYSGNPFAVVSAKDDVKAVDEEAVKKVREQQNKPFDLDAAIKRAEQGLNTSASSTSGAINFDYDAAMTRLMQGTKFSADTIPVVELTQPSI